MSYKIGDNVMIQEANSRFNGMIGEVISIYEDRTTIYLYDYGAVRAFIENMKCYKLSPLEEAIHKDEINRSKWK